MSPSEMQTALGNVLGEVQAGLERDNESWRRITQEMPDAPQQLLAGDPTADESSTDPNPATNLDSDSN